MSQRITNSTMKPGSSGGTNTPPMPRNLFQKTGSETVYEVIDTKEACIFRVDMPGSPESDLAYWVDSHKVHFFADEPDRPEYNYSGRKYGGSMVFNPKTNDVSGAKAKLVNGVLWVTVPKNPGSNASTDVIEKIVYCKLTRENF